MASFPVVHALTGAVGYRLEYAGLSFSYSGDTCAAWPARAHTSPTAAGKVFNLVKPRMAGLWHTLLSPQVIPMIEAELRTVYDGPVVQTQDLTVFNVTKEAVVARQAQVSDQLPPPTPGKQRVAFTPSLPAPPEWWAEARIPLDDRACSASVAPR